MYYRIRRRGESFGEDDATTTTNTSLGLLVASDALTGSLIRSGQRGNKKRRKIR